MSLAPGYDLRPCSIDVVRDLCEKYHAYKGSSALAVYAFAVYENERAVAAFSWQPPAVGAAKVICPEAPYAVLALSRMIAVPRTERELNHISKPLRRQMEHLIDRGRWPVLVTYHDEGQGHTGYVYKCSGWQSTGSRKAAVWTDTAGVRRSPITGIGLIRQGSTIIHRWEKWACERGRAAAWVEEHGWCRVAMPGRVWRSGNPAFKFVRVKA